MCSATVARTIESRTKRGQYLRHIRARLGPRILHLSLSLSLFIPGKTLYCPRETLRGRASESESTFSSAMFAGGPIRLSVSTAVVHV